VLSSRRWCNPAYLQNSVAKKYNTEKKTNTDDELSGKVTSLNQQFS